MTTKAEILELPHTGVQRQVTSSLGMIVFLGSWTMMFASLFASYGMLRFKAVTWPPTDVPALPVGQGSFNTLAILLSSVCLQYAIYAIRRGNPKHTTPSLLLGTLLAITFLVLQVASWASLTWTSLVLASLSMSGDHVVLLARKPSGGTMSSAFAATEPSTNIAIVTVIQFIITSPCQFAS